MINNTGLFFCLSIFMLLSCKVTGQKVESAAYNQMLSTLLSHSVPEVGVREIDTTESIVYVDARELREYEVSHIQDAIWVGYDDFEIERVGEVEKNQKIVVYCSVGYRSEKVSEKLIEAGFTDVSNLYGGIFEWRNQDQEVVDAKGETDKVHAFDRTWGVWVNKGEKVYK